MEHKPLPTLADPVSQSAKERWEQNQKRRKIKCAMTFEELFESFRSHDPCAAIAEKGEVSRQRMSQIYNFYFRSIFGNRITRMKPGTSEFQERQRLIAEPLKQPAFKDPIMAAVVARLQAAGCVVEAIPVFAKGKLASSVLARELRVNGHRCKVYYAKCFRTLSTSSGRVYAHVGLMKHVVERYAFQIFYIGSKEFSYNVFIIPRKVVLDRVFGSGNSKPKSVYFAPIEKPQGTSSKRRTQYWRYKDAWHLLRSRAKR